MMQDAPALSPEEQAALQAALNAEIEALILELWGVFARYSPAATMTTLATTAACMLMADPDVADANLDLFFSWVVDRMAKIRLLKADLGGLPN